MAALPSNEDHTRLQHRRGTGLSHTTRQTTTTKARRELTPQEYAQAIAEHAKLGSEATLYPGHSFDRLATYLRRPFERQAGRKPSPSPARDSVHSAQGPPPSFVTLYTFDALGDGDFRQFEKPEGLSESLLESTKANILFLRGQPHSEWLSQIGATYRVDPEFFQRHLDFVSTMGRIDHFSLPSLPSAHHSTIQLPYATIGWHEGHGLELEHQGLDKFREALGKEMIAYKNSVSRSMLADVRPCDSIVRAYVELGLNHFAIMQRISISVSQTPTGWSAVVWIDTGNPLNAEHGGPWAKYLCTHHGLPRHKLFLPTTQTIPFVALTSHRKAIRPERRPPDDSGQSASVLHLDYGKSLDKHLVTCDAFYAMHEVFRFCAFSGNQFLNVLEAELFANAKDGILNQSLDPTSLIYCQEYLDNHAEHTRTTINIIETRDSLLWPRATDPAMRQKADTAAQSLLKDFQHILSRAEILSKRCESRMTVLMNKAMIAESQKAIEQAKEVTKLTRLAFVFIPLSFTGTFFGMNLTPLIGQPPYGIWLWFAVSIPILLISLVFMIWDPQYLWLRFRTRLKQEH